MSDQETPEPKLSSTDTLPFTGRLTFDLTLVLMGKAVVRRLRVDYECCPEWDYFDIASGTVVTGHGDELRTRMWIQAFPDGLDEVSYLADMRGNRVDGSELSDQESKSHTWLEWDEPRWVLADTLNEPGVLPVEMMDLIDGAIDSKCRAEDERHRVKQAEKASPRPPSKRAKRRRKAPTNGAKRVTTG